MSAKSILLIARILAVISLVVLLFSALLVLRSQAGWDERYLEILSGALVACGAPILGLVILQQQPHNRIGWLWLVYGLAMAFFSLAFGLKFNANSSSPGGYSDALFVMLIFSETASIIRLICMILLILWFPNGQPPSSRWRFIYWWAGVAFLFLSFQLFTRQIPWSDIQGVLGGAPTIENPIGFLPEQFTTSLSNFLAPIGFFSIIIMSFLAVLSIVVRYRTAGQVVRAQILWFVMGSILYALFIIAFLFLLETEWDELAGFLGSLAVLPLYLAIGIAITRYRLYDIDVIIRKTLVYGGLTATLALVFFGGVTLLQNLFQALSGQQSPISIVLSTLMIAALFNPLRLRIQNGIDRRFYRKKYNAEQALARFAASARGETDIEQLSTELVAVVEETMQPDSVAFWLRPINRN